MWLVFVGIMLLALNGRTAATAIAPVLPQLASDLGLTAGQQGFLTTLPVLWFAVSGLLAPLLMRRFGLRWTGLTVIALAALGQLGRIFAPNHWVFLAWTSVALLGMGIGNIVIPSLVKRYFDGRIGSVTAGYSTMMSVGILGTAVLTVPAANLGDGWRSGLALWFWVAAVSVPVWLVLAVRRGSGTHPPKAKEGPRVTFAQVAKTRYGWLLAVFFAVQTSMAYCVLGWLPSIYQGAGFSPTEAGNLMGLFSALGIAVAFVVPALAGRLKSTYPLMLVVGISGVVGCLGLLWSPTTLPWLWAVLVALGNGGFPLFLYLLGTRARTATGTAALAAFTQTVGYLFGIPGPALLGALLGITGGWTAPLLFLLALMLGTAILGLLVCRPGLIEDELPNQTA